MDSANESLGPNYITGICEGIASFTYARNGNSLNLRFSLKLREADRQLLFSIMGFFGVGNAYHSTSSPGTMSARSGSWCYCVSRVGEIERIVRHFELHPLRGSKARSFKLWRQMYELKKIPRKADHEALFGLAAQLSSINRGAHEKQDAA